MQYRLDNPHTVAFYAAAYEADQADRDFREAHAARMAQSVTDTNQVAEYAMYSATGYADAAERLVRALPVWEA